VSFRSVWIRPYLARRSPGDFGAGQALTEILWKSMAQIGTARLDARDPTTIEDALQSADGGLDFGKFGHCGDMAEVEQAR